MFRKEREDGCNCLQGDCPWRLVVAEWDEVKDELSDLALTFSRWFTRGLGFRGWYINVPGASRRLNKEDTRLAVHGCIRSLNHQGCREV